MAKTFLPWTVKVVGFFFMSRLFRSTSIVPWLNKFLTLSTVMKRNSEDLNPVMKSNVKTQLFLDFI